MLAFIIIHVKSIDVYVSMLRRKVDKPFDTPLIQTVIGSGYKLSVEEDG